jgi:hypothetical protein
MVNPGATTISILSNPGSRALVFLSINIITSLTKLLSVLAFRDTIIHTAVSQVL